MTTEPTPAQRLGALCDALAARLRRGPDVETLHPLHDLANIVRDLHKGVQGTPGAPEATPEGDGTTTPVSGPQKGAQRDDGADFNGVDVLYASPIPDGGYGDLVRDHAFRPVAGHPDDDECTHRADETDATYCGRPAATHESGSWA